jgi:hypothetical protein
MKAPRVTYAAVAREDDAGGKRPGRARDETGKDGLVIVVALVLVWEGERFSSLSGLLVARTSGA